MNNFEVKGEVVKLISEEVFKKVGCSEKFDGVAGATIYMSLLQSKKIPAKQDGVEEDKKELEKIENEEVDRIFDTCLSPDLK